MDTSVLVAHLREQQPRRSALLSSSEVVFCGVTRAEVLHGAATYADLERLEAFLDTLQELEITRQDWGRLGRVLYELRSSGVQVPLADALLAALSLRYGLPIWSYDRHFALIRQVFPSVMIYQENR